jgi:hypothetical protein
LIDSVGANAANSGQTGPGPGCTGGAGAGGLHEKEAPAGLRHRPPAGTTEVISVARDAGQLTPAMASGSTSTGDSPLPFSGSLWMPEASNSTARTRPVPAACAGGKRGDFRGVCSDSISRLLLIIYSNQEIQIRSTWGAEKSRPENCRA